MASLTSAKYNLKAIVNFQQQADTFAHSEKKQNSSNKKGKEKK